MAIATVACPKCSQTFRSSDDVKDTKIRCPLCGFAFVVKGFVNPNDPPIAQAKPKAKSPFDDDDGPMSYDMRNINIAARCPNCANAMESEDAIICLYCGYNTQSRALGKTKKVVQQTGGDKFTWLGPGIGCVVAMLLLVLFQNYYVLGLGGSARGSDSIVSTLLFSDAVNLWFTMILAGGMWKIGQFAFKRLILEPTPPESVVE